LATLDRWLSGDVPLASCRPVWEIARGVEPVRSRTSMGTRVRMDPPTRARGANVGHRASAPARSSREPVWLR
jgi:hypothetical protein